MTNNSEVLLDPMIARYQGEARRLDPDGDIEQYFSSHYSFLELIELAGAQPNRFLPIIAVEVAECAQCGKLFNWEAPDTRGYLTKPERSVSQGEADRNMDLFSLEINMLCELVVCEDCMRKMIRRYFALISCAQAAMQRQSNARQSETRK